MSDWAEECLKRAEAGDGPDMNQGMDALLLVRQLRHDLDIERARNKILCEEVNAWAARARDAEAKLDSAVLARAGAIANSEAWKVERCNGDGCGWPCNRCGAEWGGGCQVPDCGGKRRCICGEKP